MSLAVSARGCLVVLLASLGMAPVSCSSSHDAEVVPRPAGDAFCNLPGSLRFDSSGHRTLVEGGAAKAPSLDWITLAPGYCAHYFGRVATARQIRFAPGGELFVASPSTPTSGGAPPGVGAIVVLKDDDHDGYADGDAFPHSDSSPQKLTVFTHVSAVQGLLFTTGAFYFQDDTKIMKVAYATGQTSLSGAPETVADVSAANGRWVSAVHWPKTLDAADDGSIYLGNGGDQSEVCDTAAFPRPFHGGILRIDGPGDGEAGTPVAQGFRNPIAVRCQSGHDRCFAVELGLDGSGDDGGREKIVPIRTGDDWGFPCCATEGTPFANVGSPNCSRVPAEDVGLVIGDTPFGIDFEPGKWPPPFRSNMIAVLHGAVGSWIGARVLAIPTEPDGNLVSSSDLQCGVISDLATGWDDGSQLHGRPAAITFAKDGRAFIANDVNGDIFWVAPLGLRP